MHNNNNNNQLMSTSSTSKHSLAHTATAATAPVMPSPSCVPRRCAAPLVSSEQRFEPNSINTTTTTTKQDQLLWQDILIRDISPSSSSAAGYPQQRFASRFEQAGVASHTPCTSGSGSLLDAASRHRNHNHPTLKHKFSDAPTPLISTTDTPFWTPRTFFEPTPKTLSDFDFTSTPTVYGGTGGEEDLLSPASADPLMAFLANTPTSPVAGGSAGDTPSALPPTNDEPALFAPLDALAPYDFSDMFADPPPTTTTTTASQGGDRFLDLLLSPAPLVGGVAPHPPPAAATPSPLLAPPQPAAAEDHVSVPVSTLLVLLNATFSLLASPDASVAIVDNNNNNNNTPAAPQSVSPPSYTALFPDPAADPAAVPAAPTPVPEPTLRRAGKRPACPGPSDNGRKRAKRDAKAPIAPLPPLAAPLPSTAAAPPRPTPSSSPIDPGPTVASERLNPADSAWLASHETRIAPAEGGGYRCPVEGCGLVGERKYNVRTHLRTHLETRARDHRCGTCGRTYIRVYELERHCRRKGHAR
ncbi:hypothetical protein HDU96_007250 [Phlyctochytrium bullatum]|nr:hypothetical protein HDU96_007250 [Phlyctochytrium bullatum]